MPKTLLYSAPNRMIAEEYAAELLDAGIPVKLEFAMGFGDTHPLGPAEIWIDDDKLKDPGVRSKVDDLFAEEPLTADDEPTIEAMPDSDVDAERPPAEPWWKNLFFLIVFFVVFALLLAFVMSRVG